MIAAFSMFADPRVINRRVARSRKRRVCDASISRERHFVEPGEWYERVTVIDQGFHHYVRCQACMDGWDGYSVYPGSPPTEYVSPEVAS